MDVDRFKSGLTNQQTNLLKAVEGSTLAEVKRLFPEFRSLERDEELFNYILLVAALHRGHKSISKFLLKRDCKVRIPEKTRSYSTPLYYAVKLKDVDICKDLCKRGASIHDKDANEESALEIVMVQRSNDIMKFLLKHYLQQYTNLPKPDDENDVALFHAACLFGSWDTLTFINDLKFSPRSRSGFINKEWKGFTPLHFVMRRNTTQSVALAVWKHNDTDVFARDENGNTPLHVAFKSRSFPHDLTYFYTHYTEKIAFVDVENNYRLSHFHIICSLKYSERDFSYTKYVRILMDLIKSVVNINSSVSLEDESYPGYTALHFAVRCSCFYVVKLLLKNGADPSRVDKSGLTPLHIVLDQSPFSELSEDHLKMVEILLEYGANVDAQDVQSCTPLHQAFCIRKNNEGLFQLLFSKSQFNTNLTECSGISYLHIACSENDLGKVVNLIRQGASVNSQISVKSGTQTKLLSCKYNYEGFSALHFAVKFHRVKIVQYLLSCGAHVNINIGQSAPLHLACSYDLEQFNTANPGKDPHFDWSSNRDDQVLIIKLLLEQSGWICVKDSRGYTPLLHACSIPWGLNQYRNSSYFCFKKESTYSDPLLNEISARQEIIMDILLRHGADVNSLNSNKESILHFFAQQYKACPSSKKLAEIVLKKGAKVNVANYEGITPLHIAVRESLVEKLDPSLIELFFKFGANINAQTNKLETALHFGVQNYEPSLVCQEVIETLMYTPRIDVNVQNVNGDTPLHIAVRRQKPFCVGGLLEFESDINLKNSAGETAIFIAHKWLLDESFDDAIEKQSIYYRIIIHVNRLIILKRSICDEVRAAFESIVDEYPDLSAKIDEDLVKEVAKLKSRKVDQFTSLFQILLKDPDDMAKRLNNACLNEILSSPQLTTDFPMFWEMLKNQVRRGEIRYSVLEPAKEALKLVSGMNWPDSCAEHILKSLSNINLKALIKSSKINNACERLCKDSYSNHGEPTAKVLRSK